MNNKICKAIHDRVVIQFGYTGGTRTVEPHCHGTSTAGNKVLRGFQTGGHSSSGNPIGWKLYEVAEMQNIQNTDGQFTQNRPDYNPNDRGMTQIHCNV